MIITHLKQLDWLVLAPVIILGGLGLLNLFFLQDTIGLEFFYKQVIFWVVGLGLLFTLSFFDWELLRNHTSVFVVLYSAVLLSLAAVFFFGTASRGAVSWIDLGPVSLQPSEFAKLILLLVLAKYYAFRHAESYRIRHILVSALYALIFAAPVIMQPDLGTAIIFFGGWLVVLLISGVRVRHLLLIGLVGLLIVALSWMFLLAPYQKDRIVSFFSPEQDPLGSGYARTQSLIAIGSGGMLGKGFPPDSQARLGYMPEAHTDFAFAALAENIGFAGGVAMIGLFGLMIIRLFWFAVFGRDRHRPANFSRFFSGGLGAIIAIQLFINVGMNLGMLPITGIPLPFLSYGGSGLLAFLAGIGIYQGMYAHV